MHPTRTLAILLTFTTACAASEPDASPAELYAAAVEDASTPEADEVVTDLTAIRDDNDDLVRDAEGRVLMVTWTSWPGYDGMEGQTMELGVEVWLTVAPAMQEFCQDLALEGEALDLRLEQLLGVPPGNGKDRVVQLWVPPEGLFRPSPDPEVDDRTAGLDFPDGVDPMHVTWIDDLRAASYGDDGYPWTQLGYTYDWSPDAASEVGLSEFVARGGTTVVIDAVASQADYCRP